MGLLLHSFGTRQGPQVTPTKGNKSARHGHHIIPGLSWIADPFGDMLATASGEAGNIVWADLKKVKIEEGEARYLAYRDRRAELCQTICTPMEDLY